MSITFLVRGKKFAEKYFKDCLTDYQYRKKLYLLFKERYKSKAKEKYSECYNLLKLRTEMNLNAELNSKIKIRDERRKAILDPSIDQITIVGITKGLRRLEKGNKYFN